jgi:predicted nucleic acid-binding Zn ribbon protein
MAVVKEKRKFNFILLAVLIVIIVIFVLSYFKVF